jgi:hypothetical protein
MPETAADTGEKPKAMVITVDSGDDEKKMHGEEQWGGSMVRGGGMGGDRGRQGIGGVGRRGWTSMVGGCRGVGGGR